VFHKKYSKIWKKRSDEGQSWRLIFDHSLNHCQIILALEFAPLRATVYRKTPQDKYNNELMKTPSKHTGAARRDRDFDTSLLWILHLIGGEELF